MVSNITKVKIYRQFLKHASLMPLKWDLEIKDFSRKKAAIRRIINPPAVSTVGWANNCRIVPLPC
jgi:hypothetical protein